MTTPETPASTPPAPGAPAPSAAPAAGTIHDLGYKRYLGTRRPQSTRWRVIVRNQVATGWKTWWRYKMALGYAVIVMVVFGGFIYGMQFIPGRRVPAFLAQGDPLDGFVSYAVRWFCYGGFLVGLTVGAGTIAADAQVGAFTFYFARPVRPVDYVLGKFGGVFLLQLGVIAAPLTLLAAFRAGISSDVVGSLPTVGKAALTGVLAAAAYAAVPLGLSALVVRRRNAIALWAVYYMILCNILFGLGVAGATALGQFDLQSAVTSTGAKLIGAEILPSFMHVGPLSWSLVALAVYIVGGLAMAWSAVSERAHAGVGSG